MTARRPRKPKVGGVRKGAGRPPLGADKRSEVVRVSLTPARRAEVAAAARAAEQSESDWGAQAFERALSGGSTR